jgi:hypothetical protein
VAPSDVHIQYYRWACISNRFPPEFQWIRQVKENYELTSFLKVYGGFAPQRDGEQVRVRIKSPVPMVVAILPSDIAYQLHRTPDALETALEKSACQQRGVQSLQFQCTLNASDGPNRSWLDRNPAAALLPIRRLKSNCWRRSVLRIARRPGTSSNIPQRSRPRSNGTRSACFRSFQRRALPRRGWASIISQVVASEETTCR